MPDAAWAVSGISQADPGGRVSPRFRHFRSGSLALASLNRTCQNLVPTFPQRSPPWLLTTAACGGLRSTPDCRTRRTFLHLPYSCASPCGPTMLVTQDPKLPSHSPNLICGIVGPTACPVAVWFDGHMKGTQVGQCSTL